MATVIRSEGKPKGVWRMPPSLWRHHPRALCEELEVVGAGIGRVEELRLRRECASSLTTERGTVRLQTVLRAEQMNELLLSLCDGSLYAHRDTIAAGYLTLADGIRVGVCGRASLEGDRVIGVYDISALNFRFPSQLLSVGAPVVRLLRSDERRGVLVYAPPGEGKTTLLRSVAAQMASGSDARRVAVIDSRGELGVSLLGKDRSIDLLSGYPRALGIEIATRTMNAELIVCDEIGEVREAEAILAAQNAGVPFLASAHARSVVGLLRRTGFRRLHEARVFDTYVGIRRRSGGGEFEYTVTDWESASDAT